MKRILITGVTGFVGTNLVKCLSANADYVLFGHSRDVVNANKQFSDSGITIIEKYSNQVINDLNIDTVIHLAGIAHDLSNQYKSNDYYQVNYEGTKLIFDDFVKSKANKFFFLSSIKATVDISSQVINEQVKPVPVTDYGKSKLKAEQHILSVQLPENKRAYIFRPCMIHGIGNKGNLNLLYRFAKSGLPYPFGSFKNQRSFLSMDNLNFIVEKFLRQNIPSGIYNLADDGFISTSELFILISSELGKTARVWRIPNDLIRISFSLLGRRAMLNKLTEDMKVSNQKLLQCIGQPLPITMQEGLKKTIRSFHES
jgi:nucleoside-diphosphate-sugar epimerase